jgi:DNA (cytosine-5)-methyltransferase 1
MRLDMKELPLTVVDLFCGAGGFSLGFKAAGFTTLCAADWNDSAVETYQMNLGKHAFKQDLTATFAPPPASVIVGGPPCQGFSSAGMRRVGDKRNSLVSHFAALVQRLRPPAFVFENVEGFLTAEDGRHVFELLEPLIASGYRVHLRKINAANYGVPQHRKRVIAIGGLGWDPTIPEATHSAFGAPGARSAYRHLPRTQTLAEALADLPLATLDPPGVPQGHYYRPLEGVDLNRALALKAGETMRDLPEELHHDSYRRRANRRVMDGTPTEKRGGAPAGLRRLRADEPSKAITGGARSEFLHPFEQRSLTIRECAKLQTFPDDFVFCGSSAEQGQLIGNAVPPRLATSIAKTLAQDLLNGPDVESKPGALLSFMPTVADGFSPVLRRVTDQVHQAFIDGVAAQQELLWG